MSHYKWRQEKCRAARYCMKRYLGSVDNDERRGRLNDGSSDTLE
jgi:hypothetical protein